MKDEQQNSAEEARPGFLARLKNRFKKKKATPAAETAPADSGKTQKASAEKDADDRTQEKTDEGAAKPGFMAKLKNIFRRKKATPAAETAHADSGKTQTASAEKDGKDKSGHKKLADSDGKAAAAAPSALTRLLKNPLTIILAVFFIGVAAEIGFVIHTLSKQKAEQQKAEQQKKQEQKNTPPKAQATSSPVAASAPTASAPMAASAPAAMAASAASAAKTIAASAAPAAEPAAAKTNKTIDCSAVGGKAGAGEILRRCIESFNSAGGR